jgi:hypothetical protein
MAGRAIRQVWAATTSPLRLTSPTSVVFSTRAHRVTREGFMTRSAFLDDGPRQSGVGILEHFNTPGRLTFLFQEGSMTERRNPRRGQ